MTEVATAAGLLLDAARPGEPAWLAARRQLAAERFSLLGLPDAHDEEYKYTSLARLARSAWSAPGPAQVATIPESARYEGLEGPVAVFVDGRFDVNLSSLADLPAGLTVRSIAETLAAEPAALEGALTRYADFEAHATTALNTASFADGVFIRAADGAEIAAPLHIVWIASGAPGSLAHPRALILAGRNARLQVIETFVSAAAGAYWVNPATEIVAEPGARVEHFQVQQQSLEAVHTAHVEMLAERGAYISSISLSFGAALARNDVGILLDDEGCECALDGLYVVGGKQHVDHHTRIDHAKPNCNSHQLYKGVLDGESRGVFNGKIFVRKHAQKTDAIQNNKNLLLSRKAEIDTKPQLEIDADDVRCTHGATVGQLDADALFYLRARGIPEAQARALLVYAFAADLLDRVTVEPLKLHFERLLMRTLGQDREVEEARP